MWTFTSARADTAGYGAAHLPSPAVLTLLAAAAIPIGFLALGAHDLALTKLGVPYPHEAAVPVVVRLIGQAVRIFALAALCRCASAFLGQRGAVAAALIVGVVNAALGETVRLIVINDQIYGGEWGDSLLFSLTDQLPSGMTAFYQGVAAALIARFSRRLASPEAVIATALAAGAGLFVVAPLFKAVMAAVAHAAHVQQPKQVYGMPFGFHMYKYIYATFLEPTLASLFLAFMVWPGLSGGRLRRVGAYTLLMLLARGRLFAIVVNALWLKYPWPVAVVAEGQFFVETLLMASLTGLAWDWAWRRGGGEARE